MKQAKCILTFILALGLCTLFTSCIKPPSKPDYDLYKNMQEYLLQKFQELEGYTDREDIAQYYDNYVLTLSFIPRLVFGSPQLEVHLYPGESDSVATACISQFEVPPDSDNFTDVAFTVRPNADVRAPFMHGDALKGMAGMSTSFSMDFWNVNQDAIDWETFFGDQVAKLDQGHALVEPFQRTGEDRGKYTQHLIPYKWEKYRIEIEEPDTDDETVRQAYHDAALQACKLYADAYLTALARLEPEDDAALINGTKQGTAELMDIALAQDPAAKLGLLLFGTEQEFEKYFLDAFWRADYYGPGL